MMEKCFEQLGFTERPLSEEAITVQYKAKLAGMRPSMTESDALARRVLEGNYRNCLAAFRGGRDA